MKGYTRGRAYVQGQGCSGSSPAEWTGKGLGEVLIPAVCIQGQGLRVNNILHDLQLGADLHLLVRRLRRVHHRLPLLHSPLPRHVAFGSQGGHNWWVACNAMPQHLDRLFLERWRWSLLRCAMTAPDCGAQTCNIGPPPSLLTVSTRDQLRQVSLPSCLQDQWESGIRASLRPFLSGLEKPCVIHFLTNQIASPT